MSFRVVGYDANGRRIVVEEGPARARVSGYGQGNTHDLTLIAGAVVRPRRELVEPTTVKKP